jgi:hypothetical protein
MAALECWRKGCDVQIFERAAGRITTGTFLPLHTALTTLTQRRRLLHNWPISTQHIQALARPSPRERGDRV